MRYETQTLPYLKDESLVEFYVHDIKDNTIEKIVCTKKMARLLHLVYRERNCDLINKLRK